MIKGCKLCLDSKEYMHIRNAIIVLEKINAYFPKVEPHARMLKDRINAIIKEDKREDLKIRAVGYQALLSKGEATWQSTDVFKGVSNPIVSNIY